MDSQSISRRPTLYAREAANSSWASNYSSSSSSRCFSIRIGWVWMGSRRGFQSVAVYRATFPINKRILPTIIKIRQPPPSSRRTTDGPRPKRAGNLFPTDSKHPIPPRPSSINSLHNNKPSNLEWCLITLRLPPETPPRMLPKWACLRRSSHSLEIWIVWTSRWAEGLPSLVCSNRLPTKI